MPEREECRQGRPRRTAPAGEGLAGSGSHCGWVRTRWFHVLGGERHQGDSRYRQGQAPRWPCGSASGRATTPRLLPPPVLDGGPPAPALVPALGRCLAGSSPSRALRLRAAGLGGRRGRPGPGHRPRGARASNAAPIEPSALLDPSRPGTPDRDPPGPGWHPVWRRWFPGRGRLRRSAQGPGRHHRVPRPASSAPMPADQASRRGG